MTIDDVSHGCGWPVGGAKEARPVKGGEKEDATGKQKE
jgi:hypothetical protein